MKILRKQESKMTSPLVSVNMVVYNSEQFIAEAIKSILDQTYHHFELIIVDDGSTDKTLKIIRTFNDPRIKLIIHEDNQGVVTARNTALKASTGCYIAILDADDVSLSNRLNIQVRFLENNPEFGLVGGRSEVIDFDGMKINGIRSLSFSPEDTKVHLLFRNCFTHSTVMYRKEILDNYGFNKDVPASEDYDAIVKIASQSKIRNLEDVVSKYRFHNNNISKSNQIINSNNRKIIFFQLSQIGINANKKELDLHLRVSKKIKHNDINLLLSMICWLDNLYTANKIRGIFPEPAFYNRVSGYWFNLINNPSQYKIKLLKPYFQSPILKYSNQGFIDHMKFILKCFINYKSHIKD